MIPVLYCTAALAFGIAAAGACLIVRTIAPLLDSDAAQGRASAFMEAAVTELERIP